MNDIEIQNLITCSKQIMVKLKRDPLIQNGAERYDFQVVSVNDATHKFRIFMRKNSEFMEKFSIGMDYLAPIGEDICLVRFNGIHIHHNKTGNKHQFEDFHIHQATEEALNQGFKAEDFAFITQDYRTFEEAIIVFWQHVQIQDDYLDYFPFLSNLSQLKLQFPEPWEGTR